MTDLVKRLRSVDISWSETGEWCAEAADRIEELEATHSKLAAQMGAIVKAGVKLMGFAGHDAECSMMESWGEDAECDCGYTDAWQAWAEAMK